MNLKIQGFFSNRFKSSCRHLRRIWNGSIRMVFPAASRVASGVSVIPASCLRIDFKQGINGLLQIVTVCFDLGRNLLASSGLKVSSAWESIGTLPRNFGKALLALSRTPNLSFSICRYQTHISPVCFPCCHSLPGRGQRFLDDWKHGTIAHHSDHKHRQTHL